MSSSASALTVAGGANLSHTLWTVTFISPDDLSSGVPYTNMQALLMNIYGYNLVGAQYGSGKMSLQIDDLGGLNPNDISAPGRMIIAVSDALGAAGELNASNFVASSANTAGWTFPLFGPNTNGQPHAGVPSGPSIGSTSGGGPNLGFPPISDFITPIINAIKKFFSDIFSDIKTAIWIVIGVAVLGILVVTLGGRK